MDRRHESIMAKRRDGLWLDGGTLLLLRTWCSVKTATVDYSQQTKAAVECPKILLFDLYRVSFPLD